MIKPYTNPAFRQESQSEPARIIPPRENESLHQWITAQGRFKTDGLDDGRPDEIPDELEDIMGGSVYKLEEEEEEEDDQDVD